MNEVNLPAIEPVTDEDVTQQSFREPETLGEWTFKFVQEFVPMRTLRVYVRRGILQQAMLDAGGPSMWAAPAREQAQVQQARRLLWQYIKELGLL